VGFPQLIRPVMARSGHQVCPIGQPDLLAFGYVGVGFCRRAVAARCDIVPSYPTGLTFMSIVQNGRGVIVPIAVIVEFPGATAEHYDQVIAKLGLTPGGSAMPGQLSHWVSVTDEGTRITDVWESREAFEKFAEEKMVPAVTEVGVPGPPTMAFYDVYKYFTKAP
jgi:hypothetical protein